MVKPRIAALAGSLRQKSYNKQLVRLAAAGAVAAGASVTVIDLAEHVIPLYDGDVERSQGLPDAVKMLKSMLREHDGLLIAAPEYNGSISGVLKNVIDWTSRPEGEEPPCACYKGKLAGILSASPGRFGGAKGLIHTRAVLSNIGCIVLPDQVTVANAANAFNEEGALKDERLQQAVEALAVRLVDICRKLGS